MELKLLYPTKKLESVNVGIISVKTLKLFANQNYVHDHTLGSRILSSICCSKDHTEFLDVSSIDGLRIIRQAKINTTNSDRYTPRVYCECGKLSDTSVDLTFDIEPSDIYEKEHIWQGKKIKLKPDTPFTQLKAYGDFKSGDESLILDSVLLSRIESIDGETKFDLDEFSMGFVHYLGELLEPENEKWMKLSTSESKCECGRTNIVTIDLFDQEFVLGK